LNLFQIGARHPGSELCLVVKPIKLAREANKPTCKFVTLLVIANALARGKECYKNGRHILGREGGGGDEWAPN